jgi:hypothetical protein
MADKFQVDEFVPVDMIQEFIERGLGQEDAILCGTIIARLYRLEDAGKGETAEGMQVLRSLVEQAFDALFELGLETDGWSGQVRDALVPSEN